MIVFSFFLILISMVVIDGVWLSLMFNRFYQPHMGPLLKHSLSIMPAIVLYAIYAIALNVFVVWPALKSNTACIEVFLLGLLFGLVCYGCYDLTNQVTLRDWPWILTCVDMAWGSLLTGIVSVISVSVLRYFYFKSTL